ncbi:MAG: N-acetylmuramoyl-L-alanine amidase, partial [Polyangiales bacterium]
ALSTPTSTPASLRALAQSVGAAAVSEAGSARGMSLSLLAGKLGERAYRLSGEANDARRAIDWWTVAAGHATPTSTSTVMREACEAIAAKATFSGEIARDARVTYRELYAARRRVEGSPCAATLELALVEVAAFRPPREEIDAVDRALAAEGILAAFEPSAPTSIDGRRHIVRVSRWSTSDSARVVIELDGPASYSLEPASAGTVRVRLEGVAVGLAGGDADESFVIGSAKGLLTEGKFAPVSATVDLGSDDSAAKPSKNEGAVVAILSVRKPVFRRVFFLPNPFRVVVDLTTNAPAAPVAGGPRPLHRVVLDPGHGGVDPGAVGPGGLREKDVTLSIAKAAAPVIARELGAEVRLTRAEDELVSLEERTVAGNAFEADVFVSIHCNAEPSHTRRGVELYVLDTERDELAQRVAARENGGHPTAPWELRAILDDLKIAELGTRSQTLAHLLQRSIMSSLQGTTPGEPDFSDVHDGGVHGAGFFVLVGARMPAVLIETSFISNATEEGYLARADYRARIVDAIVNGLRAYRDGK